MNKLIRWNTASAVLILISATGIASRAQTFTTLWQFDGHDGSAPGTFGMQLVQGTDGNLYGTTDRDGVWGGTIFKITTDGRLNTLYDFCTPDCTDGWGPSGSLVLDAGGNFYGTTSIYGTSHYLGTIFTVTPAGALTTLYRFCREATSCPGGARPEGLVLAADGTFYGMTALGGITTFPNCLGTEGVEGCGTIFKATPQGDVTTLHKFDWNDGGYPAAGLVEAAGGNFYGTTGSGGVHGAGTVLGMTPGGKMTSLYSFCAQTNCADGDDPQAVLVVGNDGDLYGTTALGGTGDRGTIFKITPGGALTTLYSFCGKTNCTDGEGPFAPLVLGTDGNFYGVTNYGGAYNSGTIFKITPAGTLTTLHSFDGTDGSGPLGGLCQATDGNFYGTTLEGGASDDGTVFRLATGLGPFLKTVPVVGKAGTAVTILGTNLAGATSVTFNGTPATIIAASPSSIATSVPAGATTGKVQVTTPNGTLLSNVTFQVAP
jgi:uncharacterized repeat protein (TIGR03803 family)